MRAKWNIGLGVFGILGFVVIGLSWESPFIVDFDRFIIGLVQQLESPALTGIMKFFTYIGSGLIVSVALTPLIVSILAFLLKQRLEAFVFAVTVYGSALLNVLLKLFFHRDRPDLHRIITETGYSYPSGHSMAAFTFYAILAYMFWWHIDSRAGRGLLILFSVAMILFIGTSRIYLGVHYPSDVIGAYLFSSAWLTLMIGISGNMGKRRFAARGKETLRFRLRSYFRH